MFIDPDLLLAGRVVDAAKLISRTVLPLAAARPGPQTGKHLAHGIGVFTEARMEGIKGRARRPWLREVLRLWLMDSVNNLTTYLSAPAELPLPAQSTALVDRVLDVARMVDRISTDLTLASNTQAVWDGALGRVQEVAA